MSDTVLPALPQNQRYKQLLPLATRILASPLRTMPAALLAALWMLEAPATMCLPNTLCLGFLGFRLHVLLLEKLSPKHPPLLASPARQVPGPAPRCKASTWSLPPVGPAGEERVVWGWFPRRRCVL